MEGLKETLIICGSNNFRASRHQENADSSLQTYLFSLLDSCYDLYVGFGQGT